MSYYRPSLFGGFRFFPPVIKWLLISNAALWVLIDLLLSVFSIGGFRLGGPSGILTTVLALWPPGPAFWPWQLLTYMFLHGGLFHLLFNMLALWMFGMELENLWGGKRFLLFYLLCGIAAGVTNIIVAPLIGQGAPTVGASGAVFGVLIAFGMLFPERPIYLYFLLPVKAKYFIAVYIGLELFFGVTGTTDGIAHFAHLGGAAAGFVLTLVMTGLIPLSRWFSGLRRVGGESAAGGRYGRRSEDVREATFHDIRTDRPAQGNEINQDVVDSILDKISSKGYQSLTDEEKRILTEASKKLH